MCGLAQLIRIFCSGVCGQSPSKYDFTFHCHCSLLHVTILGRGWQWSGLKL